jgi:hypothetical protein
LGPQAIQQPALEMLSRKATAVATNVPGPAQPLYLSGVRISEMMFWVPQSGSIGMGISILSYNGDVHFGLIVDSKLVPNPDDVIRRFRPEFEKLLLITLMEDWDGPIESPDAMATLLRFVGEGSPHAVATEVAGAAHGAAAGRARRPSRKPTIEPIDPPEAEARADVLSAQAIPRLAPEGEVSEVQQAPAAEARPPRAAVAESARRATGPRATKEGSKPEAVGARPTKAGTRAAKTESGVKRTTSAGFAAGRKSNAPPAAKRSRKQPPQDFASAVAAFREGRKEA